MENNKWNKNSILIMLCNGLVVLSFTLIKARIEHIENQLMPKTEIELRITELKQEQNKADQELITVKTELLALKTKVLMLELAHAK